MKKPSVQNVTTLGLRIGFIAGLLFVCFELIRYLFDASYFYSAVAKTVYLTVFFIGLPLAAYGQLASEKLSLTLTKYFIFIFVIYFSSTILVTLTSISIHQGFDTSYRERIVDYSIEQIEEKNREFEKKYNATVQIQAANLQQLRQRELQNYEWRQLLLSPIKALPVIIFMSAVVAFVFLGVQKRQTDDASSSSLK